MPKDYIVTSRDSEEAIEQSSVDMEFYEKEAALKYAGDMAVLFPGRVYEVYTREAAFVFPKKD